MLATYEKVGISMIEVITSFNQKYYDLIGRDSVDTWQQHWSNDFSLTCYVEEFQLPTKLPRVREIEFDQLDPDYWDFQQCNVKDRVKIFSKKAYSVMHAMHHSSADWIIWLDADVITTAPVTMDVWRPILYSTTLAVYMGVHYTETKSGLKGDWLVPETGVFAINTAHPDFAAFRKEYSRRYLERDSSGLRRFYDNDVFGATVKAVPSQYFDLCADFKKPYKTPLKHTVLGPYLHHHKAKHSKESYADAQ